MDIQVLGIDHPTRYFDALFKRLGAVYSLTAARSIAQLEEVASEYPPLSEANFPEYGSYGPFYWRGKGSAYMRKSDGQITVNPTSEQLDSSWRRRVEKRGDVITATTGPLASYGPYVVGSQQQPYHARRGWPTLEGVVKAQWRRVVADFVAATVRGIRG